MAYAENFMRLPSVAKSLNFSGTILGETPTLVALIFSPIFHFLYICLPQNRGYFAQKSYIFLDFFK